MILVVQILCRYALHSVYSTKKHGVKSYRRKRNSTSVCAGVTAVREDFKNIAWQKKKTNFSSFNYDNTVNAYN